MYAIAGDDDAGDGEVFEVDGFGDDADAFEGFGQAFVADDEQAIADIGDLLFFEKRAG